MALIVREVFVKLRAYFHQSASLSLCFILPLFWPFSLIEMALETFRGSARADNNEE